MAELFTKRTGIWVDELVPVFQRLDAALGLSDIRAEVAQR
jgi:hypothetical protein